MPYPELNETIYLRVWYRDKADATATGGMGCVQRENSRRQPLEVTRRSSAWRSSVYRALRTHAGHIS